MGDLFMRRRLFSLLMVGLGIVVAIGCVALFVFGAEGKSLIGGERDWFGCLGPAGYSWDKEVGACVRGWELDDSQREAVGIAVDFIGRDKLTVTGVVTARCSGCFLVGLVDAEYVLFQVTLEDWEVKMNSFGDCIGAGYPAMESYPRQCSDGNETWTEELGSKGCEIDSDCVVFGEEGDCNCGCYNRYDFPPDGGGDCFCAAPESCECVVGICGDVFGD